MTKRTWTHAELVERAGRWLRYSAHTEVNKAFEPRVSRCGVVLLEPRGVIERPDAIGWYNSGRCSILIECKATREDFLADKTKRVRMAREESGMGRFRFYMAPAGIIKAVDVCESMWGLLVCVGRSVECEKLSEPFNFHMVNEMALLWSAVRAAQATAKKVL